MSDGSNDDSGARLGRLMGIALQVELKKLIEKFLTDPLLVKTTDQGIELAVKELGKSVGGLIHKGMMERKFPNAQHDSREALYTELSTLLFDGVSQGIEDAQARR